jgi:hypothetical protein
VWAQVRLLAGNGVEIDNLSMYGRHHTAFGWLFLTSEQQFAEAAYGWGGSWPATAGVNSNTPQQGSIGPNGSFTVSHKLILSMFTQSKMLALRYCNLDLELTLGSNTADYLNLTGGSALFNIQNLQLVYDSCTLDESLVDSMYRSLLSNRVLSYPLTYYAQQTQVIPAGTTFNFTAQRVFSRLAMCWLSFRIAANNSASASFTCPTTPAGTNLTGSAPVFTAGTCPSARLSIAGVYWPNPQPAATFTELYWMLQRALGQTPNLTRKNFNTDAFHIVWDLRRTPGDPSSAVSTRSGDQLAFQLANLTSGLATECTLTMFAFDVLAVRESGPVLLF